MNSAPMMTTVIGEPAYRNRKAGPTAAGISTLAAAALFVAIGLFSPGLWAQNSTPSKPSPYQGVSHPPAGPILTDEDEPPAPVLTHRAAPAPASRPMATSSANQPAEQTAPVSAKPVNPGSEIVTTVPGPPNALPEGTVFRVYMMSNIIASDSQPGTPFEGKLVKSLMHDGRIVVPVGSQLIGRVTYATSGRRITGRSLIHLVPEEFILPDGTRYRVHAEVIDTGGSNTKATGEGDITSAGHAKKALIELGAGTGGGAVVGAVAGGPVGAAVGSLVGAGIMGAHWFLAEQAVDIPKNSTVLFTMTSPMFLTPVQQQTPDQAQAKNVGAPPEAR